MERLSTELIIQSSRLGARTPGVLSPNRTQSYYRAANDIYH